MLKIKNRDTVLTLVLTATVALQLLTLALVVVSWPYHQHNETNGNEQPSAYDVEEDSSFLLTVFDTFETHDKAITAGSTALLVVVTGGLVWLGAIAWRTSRRQARAYIHPSHIQFHHDYDATTGTTTETYDLVIKNFGQTPAYVVRQWLMGQLKDFPAVEFERPTETPNAWGAIGPTGETLLNAKVVMSRVETEAVRNEEKAVYLWGESTYKTFYWIRRKTQFRFVCVGRERIGAGKFNTTEEGNKAT